MSMTTPDRAAGTHKPVITVIEPDAIAPLDRLGPWLFAAGARLETVRLWKGEPLPAPEEIGDALVVLGGAMSAHDDATHPWLPGLRGLIRHAVDTGLPALAVCLGAQVAAEALGGRTWVAADAAAWDGAQVARSVAGQPGEHGVARLRLTPAGEADPTLQAVWAQAVRAAVRTGIPTQDGTVLPVLVSHDDAVAALPPQARLLATSQACPVHTWRLGRLIAFQHHPEATPARMADWAARDAAQGRVGQYVRERVGTGDPLADEVTHSAAQARQQAEAVDGVVQTFGQALARELVSRARAYQRAE